MSDSTAAVTDAATVILDTSTITSTIPLTTIFTPPPECSTHWTYEAQEYNDINNGLLAQNLISADLDTKCFPPGFSMYGRAPTSFQIYSPGYCPSGYATGAINDFEATTTVTCCPSNFSYYTTLSTVRYSTISTIIFAGCLSTYTGGPTTVPQRTNSEDLTYGPVTGPLTMWAQPITVAYQKKDLSLFDFTSTSASRPTSGTKPSPSATASSGASSSTSSSNPATPSPQSSGTSTGLKVGIAVLCVVLFLLAVAGCVWGWIRMRQRRQGGARAMVHEADGSVEPFRSHKGSDWEVSELDSHADGDSAYAMTGARSVTASPLQTTVSSHGGGGGGFHRDKTNGSSNSRTGLSELM